MSAILVLIAIIDIWISAIIVGLLAVRERKKKSTVEISKIVDVELPPQKSVPPITWRPINNQTTQKEGEHRIFIGDRHCLIITNNGRVFNNKTAFEFLIFSVVCGIIWLIGNGMK